MWGVNLYEISVTLLLLTKGLEATGVKYRALYGSVVGQDVDPASQKDVMVAVEIALEKSELMDSSYKLLRSSVRKQRLLYSANDVEPYVYMHTSGGSVQNRQIVLGICYKFVVLEKRTDMSHWSHQFALTRDKNKDYHMLQHTVKFEGFTSISTSQKSPTCKRNDEHYYSRENEVSLQSPPDSEASWLLNPVLTDHRYGGNLSPLKGQLQVATYNIWNFNSLGEIERYEDRLKRIKKLLQSQKFDIYGFQEVRLEVTSSGDGTQNQVLQLSQVLAGYQFVYQPAMYFMKSGHTRKEEGLAIFSKYPIVSSDYILLPRNMTDSVDVHQRICLHSEILTPLATVHVFVTHLSLSPTSQERSVMEIWKHIETYPGIKILMGDFNAESDSNVIRFLSDQGSLNGLRASGWKDLWLEDRLNRKSTGNTFSALDVDPFKRIDYVFMNQPEPPVLNVSSTQIFGNDNDCFLPCSDHYGLVSKLELAR